MKAVFPIAVFQNALILAQCAIFPGDDVRGYQKECLVNHALNVAQELLCISAPKHPLGYCATGRNSVTSTLEESEPWLARLPVGGQPQGLELH